MKQSLILHGKTLNVMIIPSATELQWNVNW